MAEAASEGHSLPRVPRGALIRLSTSCILPQTPLESLTMKATRTQAATSKEPAGVLREVSARYGVPPRRMRVLVRAAQLLSPAEMDLVEELLHLADQGVPAERRSALSRGVVKALEATPEAAARDPLSEVDEPLDTTAAAESLALAEMEAETTRAAILRDSISVGEAAELTGRSRQALERLRRAGRLLALRVAAQWRYPRWQFDPDAPGGVVPALDEVLRHLALSPAGAAVWLLTLQEQLGGASPIELLRRRRPQRVLLRAREQGWMP